MMSDGEQYEFDLGATLRRVAITGSMTGLAGFPTVTMTAIALKRPGSTPDDETPPRWRRWLDKCRQFAVSFAKMALIKLLIELVKPGSVYRTKAVTNTNGA